MNKKAILLILIACCYLGAYSQEESRILVVPISRFDFQTSYSLEDIALINKWQNSEVVFVHYRDSLLKRLSGNFRNLIVYPIPTYDYELIKSQIPRVYKEKPSTHIGVDISLLTIDNQLSILLKNLSADYILFISQYEISRRMIATKGGHEGSKFLQWANHEVTYELFDAEGNLIVMADQFKVKPRNPYQNNLNTKGVLLQEVAPNYEAILDDIYQKLLVYKQQKRKKPVYRLKK